MITFLIIATIGSLISFLPSKGAIRTYTPGYRPKTLAKFDGLKVYRNVGVGIFIHRCHNILIENSLVADNHIGIDIDRAEGIDVKNTTIIGESESYRIMKKRQVVSSVCSRQGNLIGLDLHTWKSNISLAGANIVDVKFRGFDRGSNCKTVSSIAFDKNVRTTRFLLHTIHNCKRILILT
jgi:parallel beta-helix repeat protein